MALLLPKRYLGPILTLSLPKYEKAVDMVITNVTTGKTMTVEIPVLAAALDVVFDFSAKTVIDSDGANRSAWVSAADDGLWTTEPLIEGSNDVEVEVFDAEELNNAETAQALPSTVENDASIGTVDWANPGNAKADDEARATVSLGASTKSHYLKALGFLFPDLPAGATPKGVKFRVLRSRTGAIVSTYATRFVDEGVVGKVGSKNVDSSAWPPSPEPDRSFTFGGAEDLWGQESLSVASLKAANTGFAVAAFTPGGAGVGRIDVVTGSVVYDYHLEPVAYAATAVISWRRAYV